MKRKLIQKCISLLLLFILAFSITTYPDFTSVHAASAATSGFYLPVNNAAAPDISAQSAILMEASTGVVIYEKDADAILHPASITKIMTLILIFDAIADGTISLDDSVTVSEHAASMGGSQVFLEPGETQTVDTMIKCISIASANDACVAMAEHISGSEAAFVEKMNERADGLGMLNTSFVNCCGLDVEGHMTTARDVAYMSRELITKYPEIHNYSTIWMDTITHNTRRGSTEFGLTNTNKLLKQYEWATGLKTGSTSLAKFCLSATANKNDIELIAVVMASPSGNDRVNDCISLLNYGYSQCNMYKDENPPILEPVPLTGGVRPTVSCGYKETFSCLFLDTYDASKITCHFEILTDITAPVTKGETLGMLVYEYDGQNLGSIDILALEDVEKAEYKDYLNNMFGKFF